MAHDDAKGEETAKVPKLLCDDDRQTTLYIVAIDAHNLLIVHELVST